MDQQDGRGSITYRRPEDLAWVNQARVESADRYLVGCQRLMLRVEGHDVKFFLHRILSQGRETFGTIFDRQGAANDP
jgi:hypothetical protein